MDADRLRYTIRVLSRGSTAMHKIKTATLMLLGALAAGCANIQETQFSPNMVRLDVSPPGAPVGRDTVLQLAAEVTLRYGYSAFQLTPIYLQTSNQFGVTVVMYHRDEPGAQGAFDAAAILGQYRE